jgi:predicted HTH transcriptional regulator
MPRSPGEWTEDDLLALIRDGVEEGLDLEYKQCAALQKHDSQRREISKDVSAMANSAGGTIIYGIVEKGHLPIGLDLGFDPTDITKEWLEHVILDTIRSRLNGVIINSVNLVSHAIGRVAYVVYVPQSHTAHQTSDKKYYKRFNFEATAMDDYEVRDILNRLKHPVLLPQFKLHPTVKGDAEKPSLQKYDLSMKGLYGLLPVSKTPS